MLGFGGWKKFDAIDSQFFNFTKPEQPTAKIPGTWGLTNAYKLEDIVVKHNPEYTANYTQLADKKDAKRLADSLASRFGYTSLVGIFGKWSGYYKVDEKDGKVTATYNLESPFRADYKRHVELVIDNGKVTIKHVCDEAVPEKVIAKDLQKIYKALVQRKGYFVKNATPAGTTTPATTTATTPATPPVTPPAPTPPAPANPQVPQITYAGQINTPRGNVHSAEMDGQSYILIPYQRQAQGTTGG